MSSVSAALHTPGREHFALTTMRLAISGSAVSWTYTWQLPTPVSITGTLAFSTTLLMSPAPPRGMSTSIIPCRPISSSAASWSVDAIDWMQPSGRPALAAAFESTRVMREVGVHRKRAAAQDHRVAGLHAQRRRRRR